MTSDDLATVGRALYGTQWQRDLARALDVSERNMRYWAAGRPIPESAWDDMADLIRNRRVELAGLLKSLQEGPA